jgi:gamma-glutamylcyclotransferase (GGCT)/AIG2-like uncharacterized protein YtfP
MESVLESPLRIFVYGSLKRGYRNHEAYCAGYESCCTATVVGKLYRQADGYPMLVVPQQTIVLPATSELRIDAERLARYESTITPASVRTLESLAVHNLELGWQNIRGEIYQWPADPAANGEILGRLDRLEDFHPATDLVGTGSSSLYHRVVVLAHCATGVELVWTYIAPQGVLPPGVATMGRSWP